MIGAGPAALSAAIYTTREDIDTMLIEKGVPGGLAAVTDWVDNYPGFPEGIAGLELAGNLQKQAERFGAVIDFGEVTALHDEGEWKRLETTLGDLYAKVVLVATGSDYKKLGIPGEAEYYARGVHYCATCDGAFYRDKRLVVVGGGNTAIDAAVQSKRLGAESVTLVYRRGAASMSATAVEQDFARSEGVSVIEWAQPRRLVVRDGVLAGIEFEYTQLDGEGRLMGTGDRLSLAADTVLKAIGQTLVVPPDGDGAELLQTRQGRIAVNAEFATSLPGVWAGGDCVGGKVDLTVQAVEDGKRAARAIDCALRQR